MWTGEKGVKKSENFVDVINGSYLIEILCTYLEWEGITSNMCGNKAHVCQQKDILQPAFLYFFTSLLLPSCPTKNGPGFEKKLGICSGQKCVNSLSMVNPIARIIRIQNLTASNG